MFHEIPIPEKVCGKRLDDFPLLIHTNGSDWRFSPSTPPAHNFLYARDSALVPIISREDIFLFNSMIQTRV